MGAYVPDAIFEWLWWKRPFTESCSFPTVRWFPAKMVGKNGMNVGMSLSFKIASSLQIRKYIRGMFYMEESYIVHKISGSGSKTHLIA